MRASTEKQKQEEAQDIEKHIDLIRAPAARALDQAQKEKAQATVQKGDMDI